MTVTTPLQRLTQSFASLLRPSLLVGLACLTAGSVFAQWQWLDKDGRKVFSDRAPTADIPEKNILKRPGGQAAKTAAPVDVVANSEGAVSASAKSATSAPQGAASGLKLSGVDKELDQKKKQAADAEAAKKKVEEEKITKAKIENCARAKQAKATLESGVRIGRTNAKGEREVLDDAARADETKRVKAIMDASCA
jgi:hypothetical protein